MSDVHEQQWIKLAFTFYGDLLDLVEQTGLHHDAALQMDLDKLTAFLGTVDEAAQLNLGSFLTLAQHTLSGSPLTPEEVEIGIANVEAFKSRFDAAVAAHQPAFHEVSVPEFQSKHHLIHHLRQMMEAAGKTLDPTNAAKLSESLGITVNPELIAEHESYLMRLPRYTDNVVQAGVIQLIILFETLLSDVLALHYRLHPGALTSTEKLTLDEYKRLGTHEKAVEYVIDQELTKFMHGSLEEWQKALEKMFGINLREFGGNWEAVLEVFQRRNLLVHTGGRVNRLYQVNVPASVAGDVPYGEVLFTDLAYFEQASSLLSRLALFIISGVWGKILPKRTQVRLGVMAALAKRAMDTERWAEMELLTSLILREKNSPLDPAQQMTARLNHLLAIKRQRGVAAIAKDLEQFEHSTRLPRFAAVAYALGDDFEGFMRVYPASHLTAAELQNWPVFEEFRANPLFTELYTPQAQEAPPESN